SETSANPTGLRVSLPLKITSAISSPRSDLADCSPSAQRTASSTLDFPQPFGPIMAVMPWWKLKIVLSANDLKPRSSIDCKCMCRPQSRTLESQYRDVLAGASSFCTTSTGRHPPPAHDIVSDQHSKTGNSDPKHLHKIQSFQLRILPIIVLPRV